MGVGGVRVAASASSRLWSRLCAAVQQERRVSTAAATPLATAAQSSGRFSGVGGGGGARSAVQRACRGGVAACGAPVPAAVAAASLGAAHAHSSRWLLYGDGGSDGATGLRAARAGRARVLSTLSLHPAAVPLHRRRGAAPDGSHRRALSALAPGVGGGAGAPLGLTPPPAANDGGDNGGHGGHAASKHAVRTAIWCNIMIFASKIVVWSVSGSAAILAESVHSLVDIANQTLLHTGIVLSQRTPDSSFNYGYRRELFVWSLISGVGIFCLGAGVSLVHGVHHMLDPQPLEHVGASLAVLLASLVIESYSLAVAYRSLVAGAAAKGMSVREYAAKGLDPTTLAIVCEDGGAVVGLIVAGACLATASVTGNAAFDAAGSVAVGGLLAAIAVYLIQTNRRALLGRSLDRAKVERIERALRADDVVANVLDCKSEEIGPGVYRLKLEVEFDGDQIVERYLAGRGAGGGGGAGTQRDHLHALFRASNMTSDARALDAALTLYGKEMVAFTGDQVDRLEALIMEMEPSIVHVDMETD